MPAFTVTIDKKVWEKVKRNYGVDDDVDLLEALLASAFERGEDPNSNSTKLLLIVGKIKVEQLPEA